MEATQNRSFYWGGLFLAVDFYRMMMKTPTMRAVDTPMINDGCHCKMFMSEVFSIVLNIRLS